MKILEVLLFTVSYRVYGTSVTDCNAVTETDRVSDIMITVLR